MIRQQCGSKAEYSCPEPYLLLLAVHDPLHTRLLGCVEVKVFADINRGVVLPHGLGYLPYEDVVLRVKVSMGQIALTKLLSWWLEPMRLMNDELLRIFRPHRLQYFLDALSELLA